MFNHLRYSPKYFRPWLLAAAIVLLLTSVIEAGHVHGVFTEANDHCVLCEHSVAMDKAIVSASEVVILQLGAVLVVTLSICCNPQVYRRFALIRAPPLLP